MTTTTKIFVVLVCIFTFIFTPIAISFATRVHDWRDLAEQYVDHVETSSASFRAVQSIAQAQINHYRGLMRQAKQEVQNRDQTIAGLEENRDALQLQYDELDRQRESWRTSAERLTAEMSVINAHNQELVNANKNLTSSELELASRSNDLSERVKELTSQVVILQQELRQAQENAAFYAKENEDLRKTLQLGRASSLLTSGAASTAEASSPAGWAPVRGEVTEVKGNLATINVGSSAGVGPNMTMVVLRDNTYVCDLVVTDTVTPTEAVASVQLTTGLRVRAGDSIMDVASFNER